LLRSVDDAVEKGLAAVECSVYEFLDLGPLLSRQTCPGKSGLQPCAMNAPDPKVGLPVARSLAKSASGLMKLAKRSTEFFGNPPAIFQVDTRLILPLK